MENDHRMREEQLHLPSLQGEARGIDASQAQN
jgi:hypothetical protein